MAAQEAALSLRALQKRLDEQRRLQIVNYKLSLMHHENIRRIIGQLNRLGEVLQERLRVEIPGGLVIDESALEDIPSDLPIPPPKAPIAPSAVPPPAAGFGELPEHVHHERPPPPPPPPPPAWAAAAEGPAAGHPEALAARPGPGPAANFHEFVMRFAAPQGAATITRELEEALLDVSMDQVAQLRPDSARVAVSVCAGWMRASDKREHAALLLQAIANDHPTLLQKTSRKFKALVLGALEAIEGDAEAAARLARIGVDLRPLARLLAS
eukprot:tig00021537_g22269.t1